MSTWDEQFGAMRQQFLIRASDRLIRMADALRKLQTEPTDRQTLADVRQHFHWLTGVGGTYKLPAVSELGATAEDICDRMLESNQNEFATEVEELRRLLEQASNALSDEMRSSAS